MACGFVSSVPVLGYYTTYSTRSMVHVVNTKTPSSPECGTCTADPQHTNPNPYSLDRSRYRAKNAKFLLSPWPLMYSRSLIATGIIVCGHRQGSVTYRNSRAQVNLLSLCQRKPHFSVHHGNLLFVFKKTPLLRMAMPSMI